MLGINISRREGIIRKGNGSGSGSGSGGGGGGGSPSKLACTSFARFFEPNAALREGWKRGGRRERDGERERERGAKVWKG